MSNKKTKAQVPFPTAQATKGLVTVQMGGKQRTLKFGTNCMGLLMRMRGITVMQEAESMFRFETFFKDGEMTVIPYFTMTDVRDLLYCALVAHCYSKGEEVDFNEWQVGDWMDDLGPNEVARIIALKAEADKGPELPEAVKAKIKQEAESPNGIAPQTNR